MAESIGLQLLKLMPLISSTVNLQFASDEIQFFSAWTEMPQDQTAKARQILPWWMSSYLNRALYQVLIGLPLPIATGVAQYIRLRPAGSSVFRDLLLYGPRGSQQTASRWYLAGSFFALAHFFFAPKAKRLLEQMSSQSPASKETNIEAVNQWLQMHYIRSVVADIPAFVCFLRAAMIASARPLNLKVVGS
ncbi:hypothetical protein K461DRAFT_275914 [Myriangium duriaei CBS 260.36]|uniref:Uncharacterized protein n=1 Tax=Myriangium duriaei CBS 260.36 TaxID=1168546 RepID=A0A9P4MHH1_9PEZI|nr:hypothetical protein K461DRAFT_275914 [Myriangium duriaei CBS 260.36]